MHCPSKLEINNLVFLQLQIANGAFEVAQVRAEFSRLILAHSSELAGLATEILMLARISSINCHTEPVGVGWMCTRENASRFSITKCWKMGIKL